MELNVMNTLDRYKAKELEAACNLLNAYRTKERPSGWYDDGVYMDMNENSGYVFLVNSDSQVLIEKDGELYQWIYTPYNGFEGTIVDLIQKFHEDEIEGKPAKEISKKALTEWELEDVEYLFQENCFDDVYNTPDYKTDKDFKAIVDYIAKEIKPKFQD